MQPTPHPALAQLERFIGMWEVTLTLPGQEPMTGVRSTFEWLENGAYVLERSVWSDPDRVPAEVRAESPIPTTRIIGYDDTTGTFCMLFADNRAVARIYQMRLAGDRWEIWRDAPDFGQRYIGEFDPAGRTISGRWELSHDNRTWNLDFHLTYTKLS
jgi:hypothetical protein